MSKKSKKSNSVKKSTSGAVKSVKHIKPNAPVLPKVEQQETTNVEEVKEPVKTLEKVDAKQEIKQPDTKQKDKKVKEQKKAEKKKEKEKKPSVVVKKTREISSELKKVSWPSFSKVVKQTGVVIAVVFIFAVIVFGIDRLLSLLFDLFTKGLV